MQASSTCFFCGGAYFEKDCRQKKKASDEAKKYIAERKANPHKYYPKRKQNAQEASQEPEQANVVHMESAGHASALSSVHHP